MIVGLTQALVLSVVLSMGFAPICTGQAGATDGSPLHVMLTNDDGYSAPGIAAVRSALIESGFRVTVVAPAEEQSGSSVRVSSSTTAYEQKEDGVWTVGGSPADAVLVGLSHILRDDRPDIVVSGANFGQNLGRASTSGTVGAATMAMYRGIPAIAVSVGMDFSESDSEPTPFPSTHRAFPHAATFTVALIRELITESPPNEDLLPNYTLLNVNYPALEADEIQGTRFARAARASAYQGSYRETRPGELRLVLRHASDTAEDLLNTDIHFFRQGYVTITVLDGDWDAGEVLRTSVSERLSTITRDRF